jgi:hypothetical protein
VQEPWTAFRHFISQLEIINSLSSSNDSFVRTAAQRLGGYEAGRIGVFQPRVGEPEYEILGATGWNPNLIDNEDPSSPARHFIGLLAAGYFHPHTADDQLEVNEAPGALRASLQDRRSGELAIDLGIRLRRGRVTRLTLIYEIERDAGDPSYMGGSRPNEDVGDNPPLACYLLPGDLC